jgi:electron transfer flavoprotein beta subunit
MKIVVSVKEVPARDSHLRADSHGTWLDEADLSFEINEPDAYALEEALQLKEKLGGEVVVVCAGPERAAQTIREALAKGADRAIHVRADTPLLNPLSIAKLLAPPIESEKPDLVLTGLQSDDLGFGQTGVIVAELLGWAHATIVVDVEPAADTVRVKRELEDGWYQHVTLPLPAVLTVQSGIKKLRSATLMGIKKAKSKEVRVIESQAVPANPLFDRIYAPERKKSGELLRGDAKQAAAKLVEKLRHEARLL